MTEPEPSLPARRPPAPPRELATVTRLAPAGAEREVVPVATVVGTLALDLGLRAPAPAPPLHLLPGGLEADAEETAAVQAWAQTFVQATVEVIGGDRPVTQLLRWTTARVYADLDRRVHLLARTSGAPQRRRTVRAQVRSVHVCQPQAGCAEVSVHVRHGHRSRAVAARLELRRDRWTCVALELG